MKQLHQLQYPKLKESVIQKTNRLDSASIGKAPSHDLVQPDFVSDLVTDQNVDACPTQRCVLFKMKINASSNAPELDESN